MRIGTTVNFNNPTEIEEKFATLGQYNFDSCQLISWNPKLWTDENAALINGLVEKYGITISAFWCGWQGPVIWNFYDGPASLGLVPKEYRPERTRMLLKGAEFAK